MSAPGDGSFTVKEIVIEIRDAVKDLASKIDRIDREGSIGTRDQLAAQDRRLREHDSRIDAIEAWKDGTVAVAGFKKWQLGLAVGVFGLVVSFLTALATVYWLHHG